MRVPSGKEKAALRNAAQKLKPAVHVGKRGITPELIGAFERSLSVHRLVKVSFKAGRDEIQPLIETLEAKASCYCVGGVGKRRSFFRPEGQ